jgi:hypothetical protein
MTVSLFSYIGPETMLPLASAFAAIVGAILVCWRWILGFLMKVYRLIFRRSNETESETHDIEEAVK